MMLSLILFCPASCLDRWDILSRHARFVSVFCDFYDYYSLSAALKNISDKK